MKNWHTPSTTSAIVPAPTLWKHDVDDTCCILKDKIDEVLDHLNNGQPGLPTGSLNIEFEKNVILPFLNLKNRGWKLKHYCV